MWTPKGLVFLLGLRSVSSQSWGVRRAQSTPTRLRSVQFSVLFSCQVEVYIMAAYEGMQFNRSEFDSSSQDSFEG